MEKNGMRENVMEKNGMRKRRIGNYLKAYPHIYEIFEKSIKRQNFLKRFMIVYLVFCTLGALLAWLTRDEDIIILCAMPLLVLLLIACIFLPFLVLAFRKSDMIGTEELELMEQDLSGEKEKFGNCGYSTEESIIINLCRIPRKGLDTVYMRHTLMRGGVRYILEFFYEDGTCLSAGLENALRASDEKEAVQLIIQLIHRYDDSIKIYKYRGLEQRVPLFCPFERLDAEMPFMSEAAMEELNTLCNGNPFWYLVAKSRDRWDGNKDVELTLYGTVLTWLLYFAWICLSVYLFFYACFRLEVTGMLLVLLGSGLCYYLFFSRSARKVTGKAAAIFYKALFDGKNG